MVKPVKHAEQFKTQWQSVFHQMDQARGNVNSQKKVMRTALKLFKDEVKHDPTAANTQLKQAMGDNYKLSEQEQRKVDDLIEKSTNARVKRMEELIADVAKSTGLSAEDMPILFFVLTARELLAATDNSELKKNAPKILEKIAELEHLAAHQKIDDNEMERLFRLYKDKLLPLKTSIAGELTLENVVEKVPAILSHLEREKVEDKAPLLAFIRLCELHNQEKNLAKLGLTSAQIDRYPVDTPYLGRNGVEPVIGFRRRATIAMQNIRSKILPSYAEKAKEGQVQQSYNKAIKICNDKKYDANKGSQYGGDNPADLRADLARTLAKAKPIQRGSTEITLIEGDSVQNAKDLRAKHTKLGIVNCANKDRFGGSWDVARGSQEESLFRQSNLSAALKSTVDKLRGRRQNHIPAAGVIVNSGVTFMDPTNESGTFTCDVVSVAAVDYRKHNTRQHSEIAEAAKQAGVTTEEFMRQATKNKYAAMFGAFLENRNTDLLISLPGLGAFENDREMVMGILKELLTDDDAPFKNMFNSITFNVFKMEGDATANSLKRDLAVIGRPEMAPPVKKPTVAVKNPETHEEIVSEMIGSKSLTARASEKPTAFLFMGGAASGKSTLQEKMMEGCRAETLGHHDEEAKGPAYVRIDSDLVKEHIPGYDPKNPHAVHRESTKVARELFHQAKENRQHIAYMGTGQDARYYKNLIKQLKKEGYVVHLVMAELDETTAIARANQRDRQVPEAIVRETNRKASQNFEEIAKEADSWVVYDTSQEDSKILREKTPKGEVKVY